MRIADRIMKALAVADGPLTVRELASLLSTSEPHVRQGIAVLLAGGHVAPVGKRKGHGRSAVEYEAR